MNARIDTRELRRERVACDPVALCRALGIDRIKTRQTTGLLVCCPAHDDRTPSCSVTRGPDGTLRVKCFACDFTADAIGLVRQVRGTDFRGAVEELVRLTGRWDLLDVGFKARLSSPPPRKRAPRRAILSGSPSQRTSSRPGSQPAAPKYLKWEQLDAVWSNTVAVADDAEAGAMLASRGLDVERIDDLGLARVISKDSELPPWARNDGKSWAESGHRLLFRVFDARGACRSFRAWRVIDGPPDRKRLTPARHSVGGLVLADPFAVAMLRDGKWLDGRSTPPELVISEGESDFLTWATEFSDADEDAPIMLGVFSGAWTEELASRVPDGARVSVRTDRDQAGDRYAAPIIKSLDPRCEVYRMERSSTEAA